VPGRLSPATVRQQIASGQLEPLYLLTGNDEMGMSELASAIADTVEEDLRPFNVQRFYGSDTGLRLAAVLDAANTLPLLAPRRVVVLLQAERLLVSRKAQADVEEPAPAGEGEDASPKTQLALLKEYAKRPHPHATVVVAGGSALARSFDSMSKTAAVVVLEASFDVIGSLAAQQGVRFDRAAADLLKQRAGGSESLDSGRLRDDVERVLLYTAGRQVITREMVAEVVGRQAPAGGWTLANQVGSGNTVGALRELRLLLAEGAVPFMLLGMLRPTVERVAARDLPRAMDALMRTDLALKTSAGDPRVLLERLIVEFCGLGRE
jgi:DNA polymerase III delta subunit